MKYNQLNITANRKIKRVGRGISAGQGKTAGRGTKGQGSRTGSKAKPGFAGGTNPLMQQLPKLPGFHSHRTKSEVVYTAQLEQFSSKTIDNAVLAEAGLVSNGYTTVKLISKGELTKKVTVRLQSASASAIATIQEAGGSFEKTSRPSRAITNPKRADKKAHK